MKSKAMRTNTMAVKKRKKRSANKKLIKKMDALHERLRNQAEKDIQEIRRGLVVSDFEENTDIHGDNEAETGLEDYDPFDLYREDDWEV